MHACMHACKYVIIWIYIYIYVKITSFFGARILETPHINPEKLRLPSLMAPTGEFLRVKDLSNLRGSLELKECGPKTYRPAQP